jgi:hypothetical protein
VVLWILVRAILSIEAISAPNRALNNEYPSWVVYPRAIKRASRNPKPIHK